MNLHRSQWWFWWWSPVARPRTQRAGYAIPSMVDSCIKTDEATEADEVWWNLSSVVVLLSCCEVFSGISHLQGSVLIFCCPWIQEDQVGNTRIPAHVILAASGCIWLCKCYDIYDLGMAHFLACPKSQLNLGQNLYQSFALKEIAEQGFHFRLLDCLMNLSIPSRNPILSSDSFAEPSDTLRVRAPSRAASWMSGSSLSCS